MASSNFPPDKKGEGSSNPFDSAGTATSTSNNEAPPPYTRHPSTGGGPGPSTSIFPAGVSGPAAGAPLQIYPSPGPKQHLHIYRDSMFNNDMTIMQPNKTSIAFTVSVSSGRRTFTPSALPAASAASAAAHVRVFRGPIEIQSQHPPVGTITFRPTFHLRGADLTFHGRPVALETSPSPAPFSAGAASYVFIPSPLVGPLTWLRTAWAGGGGVSAMTLVNSAGRVMARYEPRTSVDKKGVLEVEELEIGMGECLDEVVTSLVAMLEMHRQRRH